MRNISDSGYDDPDATVSFTEYERRNKDRHSSLKPVGWLVCTEGADFGRFYTLKEGRNLIGSGINMDVDLSHDLSITKENIAWIEFLEDTGSFMISPGNARQLIYVNDDLIFKPTMLLNKDILTMGETSLMLVACCDSRFSWRKIKH